jgi:DNA-binding transcriptional MerR regulator
MWQVLVLKDLEKDNYSIGETAKILGIEQHVVRFWSNTFFDYIKPIRKAGERRYYRKKDIEILFKIKDMVYNQKYSLGGVKIVLQNTTSKEIKLEFKKVSNTKENKDKLDKLYSEISLIKTSIEDFLAKS